MKILLTAFLVLTTLTACNRETDVTGDIFVVTQGKDSKKLGLVTVGVYKAEEILFAVNLKNAARQTSYDSAEKALLDCSKYSGRVPEYYDSYEYKRLGIECEAQAQNLIDVVPSIYFDTFPRPEISVSTDADGKFSLKLPKQGKYVLAATTDRKIGEDRKEVYYWLVPVTATGNPVKVTMSNDNLVKPSESPAIVLQNAH